MLPSRVTQEIGPSDFGIDPAQRVPLMRGEPRISGRHAWTERGFLFVVRESTPRRSWIDWAKGKEMAPSRIRCDPLSIYGWLSRYLLTKVRSGVNIVIGTLVGIRISAFNGSLDLKPAGHCCVWGDVDDGSRQQLDKAGHRSMLGYAKRRSGQYFRLGSRGPQSATDGPWRRVYILESAGLRSPFLRPRYQAGS